MTILIICFKIEDIYCDIYVYFEKLYESLKLVRKNLLIIEIFFINLLLKYTLLISYFNNLKFY